MVPARGKAGSPVKRKAWGYYFKRDLFIYGLIALPMLYYVVFKYLPMFGIVIAFQDYKPFLGLQGMMSAKWVGLRYIRQFIRSIYFVRLMRNTFLISFYSLLWGFPAPILLALMLNEVRNHRFRKVVQTISYLPHFLSAVIVAGMIRQIVSTDGGLVNLIAQRLTGQTYYILGESRFYRTLYVGSGIWQGVGWGSILYLAAMSGIDPALYEAAEVDGATIFQRMGHVTLPSILPIISIMLIFRVGDLLSVGYEKTLLLYSPMIYDVSDIISTYVYREGLVDMKYSYSTAINLFISVISMVMVIGSNTVAKKMGQEGVW